MQLFLDCDGVLADFDKMFIDTTGHNPRSYEDTYGQKAFWKLIANHRGGWFNQLPLLEGAAELVEATKHLNPIILTGIPAGTWAVAQKHEWRDKHFPDLDMICCKSKEKYMHMHDEKHNVIVDDWDRYKPVWEEAGGTFILHTSLDHTLSELREIGLI